MIHQWYAWIAWGVGGCLASAVVGGLAAAFMSRPGTSLNEEVSIGMIGGFFAPILLVYAVFMSPFWLAAQLGRLCRKWRRRDGGE